MKKLFLIGLILLFCINVWALDISLTATTKNTLIDNNITMWKIENVNCDTNKYCTTTLAGYKTKIATVLNKDCNYLDALLGKCFLTIQKTVIEKNYFREGISIPIMDCNGKPLLTCTNLKLRKQTEIDADLIKAIQLRMDKLAASINKTKSIKPVLISNTDLNLKTK